ncbi:enoyl-CoA hydratase [Actinophytocola xinjiangensis]|uniref:Enoyl-CoA hydratase n=1 Tax=Actinophytocola xinjiangensis TaxID=485602 RepID=A0A7Z0WGS8_9PSEU|nr:enoyl-CoA hydratase-related protein [Actinophytocola xinjiangensis]OLF06813.1 enoyl-CoA hydratase [Actinophytocola xinjiangensis]
MTIDLTVADGIATITIDSPKTRNALNPTSSRQLVEVCDQVAADRSVGAAIVRGGGGTFCSGAEREVLARAGEDPADPERFAELGAVYDAFVRVGSLPVPTIAAVRGAAVGAGVNLLLATDLRVVATDARILAGFTRIGIHPGGGHFTLLGRLVGREAAAAIGMFGVEVSGARAAQLGLAWEAVDDEAVDARARELAASAARDPELSRRVLGSLRAELDPPGVSWPAALELERGSQMWSLRRRATTK